MLRGIHIQSSAPSRVQGQNYHPSSLEVSSMVLSALLWRKQCGTIKLYTDTFYFEFLSSNGLEGLWNGGIDTDTIDSIPPSVNQKVFWAAAKLFALRDAEAPVAMVDGDLFFWEDISKKMDLGCVTVLHREDFFECYVDQDLLGTPPNYQFDSRWDWKQYPCNTAFAYFPTNNFKNTYVTEAICFMTNNQGKDVKPSSQMVFAEQRILAMCAKRDNIPINVLIRNPFDHKNKTFTHLWGTKSRAKENDKDMMKLMSAILNKIKGIDNYYYSKLKNIW